MAEALDAQKAEEFQKAINSVIDKFYPGGSVEEIKISSPENRVDATLSTCQWKCWTSPAGNNVCGWVC